MEAKFILEQKWRGDDQAHCYLKGNKVGKHIQKVGMEIIPCWEKNLLLLH